MKSKTFERFASIKLPYFKFCVLAITACLDIQKISFPVSIINNLDELMHI